MSTECPKLTVWRMGATYLYIIEVHLLQVLIIASNTLQYLLDVGGIWGLIRHRLILVRLHHT